MLKVNIFLFVVITKPGVARAVLQIPSLLIQEDTALIHPLSKYLQNTFTTKS